MPFMFFFLTSPDLRFGDTMNTTARIESTSKPGRIQMSKETGELVIQAGKGHWIEKREQKVEAKGKGALQGRQLRPFA